MTLPSLIFEIYQSLFFFPLCRETGAYMEGGGPGAEAPLLCWMYLLPAATALWADERERKVLLQWPQSPHFSLCIIPFTCQWHIKLKYPLLCQCQSALIVSPRHKIKKILSYVQIFYMHKIKYGKIQAVCSGILFISCRKKQLENNYKWKIAHTYTFHYSEQFLSCVPHNATN